MSALQKVPDGATWDEGVTVPEFPSLRSVIEADVCIVGGGLTGIVTAYMLAESRTRVVLIDKGHIGNGATGATTGFLTEVIDTRLAELISMVGVQNAAAIVESHRQAVSAVETIVRTENLDCDFMRCANIMYARSEKEHALLHKEFEAGVRLGIPMALGEAALAFTHHGYIAISRQAKFHPLRYLYALAKRAEEKGVQLYQRTKALALEKPVRREDGGDGLFTQHLAGNVLPQDQMSLEQGAGFTVKTENGEVRAKHVILATYEPFTKPLSLYFKKAFYTSYVFEASIPSGAVPEGTYEDLGNPYHYFRVDKGDGHDRLIFGGEDHRSDIPAGAERSFEALASHARELFPALPLTFVRKWHGCILESVDGLPYIGTFGDERLLVAMAFSGNGMTYAHIAARMFADHLSGKPMPWKDIYAPERIPKIRSLAFKGRDYAEELWGGAITNFFTPRGADANMERVKRK